MKILSKLKFFLIFSSPIWLAAQEVNSHDDLCPFSSHSELGFTVLPATGALNWTLPAGEVPGAIPVPVVFRFRASVEASLTRPTQPCGEMTGHSVVNPLMASYRGIWGSLHFGFITPARELDGGITEEGTQVLEDGRVFRDQDWTGNVAVASDLPGDFGFVRPVGGYLLDITRTIGLYDATIADLGPWQSRVAKLTHAVQFKILLDRGRARVYAYHEALKAFVPVLWVDRSRNWVEFKWEEDNFVNKKVFTVRVSNPAGQGVQVSWAAPSLDAGTEEVDLLRADFLGMNAQSLLVRGFEGAPDQLPSSLSRLRPMARMLDVLPVGGPIGRPTRIQWGPPASLPLPEFMTALPEALDQLDSPVLEWTFTYADSSMAELASLRDPWGATTTFSFQDHLSPFGVPLIRSLNRSLTTVPSSGATRALTWSRTEPRFAGDRWIVSCHENLLIGKVDEERTITHSFDCSGTGAANSSLRAIRVQESSGVTMDIIYRPSLVDSRLSIPSRAHYSAPGKPDLEILLENDSHIFCQETDRGVGLALPVGFLAPESKVSAEDSLAGGKYRMIITRSMSPPFGPWIDEPQGGGDSRFGGGATVEVRASKSPVFGEWEPAGPFGPIWRGEIGRVYGRTLPGRSDPWIGKAQDQTNQQKIQNLQVINDSTKTTLDTQAIRDYLVAVGVETVKAAISSGIICGETAATIGAVLGVGVGGAALGGVGAMGGAIIAAVGALSYVGVTEGVKLQEILNKIRSSWEANYKAIQNYSNINCIGAPPEIRY